MDIQVRKVEEELRKQQMPESLISGVIPDFYEDKCGQFLYPLIPFDARQWKRNPKTESKRPPGRKCPPGEEAWTYKKFEKKLASGVLAIPRLNLENVPKSIFGFVPPLRIIYLNDNALTELPPNLFDDLPTLAWLDVRNNKLKTIPELSKPHHELRTLLLQDNAIIRLPRSLHKAHALTSMILRGNPLIDPPSEILQSGTSAILTYLANEPKTPTYPDWDVSESEIDEAMSLLPPLQPIRKPRSSIIRNISKHFIKDQPQKQEELELPNSKTLKSIYSDGLWRYSSHEGPSPFDILTKAKEDMRLGVEKKFSEQKEVILQRIKDKEARQTFRTNTHDLQLKGIGERKANSYKGLETPFGTSKNVPPPTEPLDFETFHHEFLKNWDKLNELTSNPIPLQNAQAARERLKEVEDIQRKISAMKLSMKIPI